MPVPEEVLDYLHRARPADFVRTRARLAAELREAGEPYAAIEVEARRKPTAAVWAVNQLSREDRLAVERAIRSADALRALQLGRGRGDADTLRQAAAEHRETVSALVERAEAALRAASLPVTRTTLARVATTVRTAIARTDARDALRRGELTGELAPAGFEVLAGESASRGSRDRSGAEDRRTPAPGVRQDRTLRLVQPGERSPRRPGAPRRAGRGVTKNARVEATEAALDALGTPAREAPGPIDPPPARPSRGRSVRPGPGRSRARKQASSWPGR
jgi:hypothetical protein